MTRSAFLPVHTCLEDQSHIYLQPISPTIPAGNLVQRCHPKQALHIIFWSEPAQISSSACVPFHQLQSKADVRKSHKNFIFHPQMTGSAKNMANNMGSFDPPRPVTKDGSARGFPVPSEDLHHKMAHFSSFINMSAFGSYQ